MFRHAWPFDFGLLLGYVFDFRFGSVRLWLWFSINKYRNHSVVYEYDFFFAFIYFGLVQITLL